jgi:hypothetical protein
VERRAFGVTRTRLLAVLVLAAACVGGRATRPDGEAAAPITPEAASSSESTASVRPPIDPEAEPSSEPTPPVNPGAEPSSEPTPPVTPEPTPPSATSTWELPYGRRLSIVDGRASILAADGTLVAQNDGLIRPRDGNRDCPSDGFQEVDVNGEVFVIRQRNCSGWYLISERLEFRTSARSSDVHLELVSLVYFDRRAPDSDEVVRTLTFDDFGAVRFEAVELDALYNLALR